PRTGDGGAVGIKVPLPRFGLGFPLYIDRATIAMVMRNRTHRFDFHRTDGMSAGVKRRVPLPREAGFDGDSVTRFDSAYLVGELVFVTVLPDACFQKAGCLVALTISPL